MADVKLHGEFELKSQQQEKRLAYVYEGELELNGEAVSRGELLQLDSSTDLALKSDAGAGVIVLAAKPINEPIAQYGPFVMNTSEELDVAIKDYQSGTLAANQKL